MKILLISDTHGKVHKIAEAAMLVKPDICIHSGDFGFYDEASVKSLTQKEVYLQIRHSDLQVEEKTRLLGEKDAVRRRAIAEKKMLGGFPEYLSGDREFGWPIYSIWGNHDDSEVVKHVLTKSLPKLTVLHDKTYVDCGAFYLLGLGGNCILNESFTNRCKGIPGPQCRPTSVLWQYLSLMETAMRIPSDKPKVLVTHVSPLIEPFLELLAWKIGAVLTVSGHMGFPDGQIGTTTPDDFSRLEETYQKLCEKYPKEAEHLKVFAPIKKDHKVQHINLPDAKDGHAILEWEANDFKFEMKGKSYYDERLKNLGSLKEFASTVIQFSALEYERMLPIAKKIIAGEETDECVIETLYEQMMNTFGADPIIDLFFECCKQTEKTQPNLTNAYRTYCKETVGR